MMVGGATGQATTYRNPILDADWPDPDVIRVGSTYFLVASSFNRAPGLPLLTSTDLVHWQRIGHALPALPPVDHFRLPRHGGGVWAPSIRHHDGLFWIVYPDPDHGIFVLTASDPAGEWSEPQLLFGGRGLIDPCPLWDDDGRAYLIYGFAHSRAGVKNLLAVQEISADASELIGPSKIVINGEQLGEHGTLEGPKFYKRDGWYWVFAPAGGVATGFQAVFRSRSVWGPYEDRIVLAQGQADINGPHQGGWVDTPAGEDWFIHFQDRGVFGRVAHLQPMSWDEDGWPRMGRQVGPGPGEPVSEHPVPALPVGEGSVGPGLLDGSDDFTGTELGKQWYWQANPDPDWHCLAGDGRLVLRALANDPGNLRNLPQVLGQQLPGQPCSTTVRLTLEAPGQTARAGLLVLGRSYTWIGLDQTESGISVVLRSGGSSPNEQDLVAPQQLVGAQVELRVDSDAEARCRFSWREPGADWIELDADFQAVEGQWIGAELAIFACTPPGTPNPGSATFESWATGSSPTRH